MSLLTKSFDTIDFRSGKLIDMALQIQLEYTEFEIAELSCDRWIEHVCELQKPNQMLVAFYRLMLNIDYRADTIDFTEVANCKANTKRLIELVNEHRNMAPVPKQINCPR